MRSKLFVSVRLVLTLVALAMTAHGSLTPSEQAQVRQYVASGQVQNAARVRALVARTDLTPEETAQALKDALVPVAFDETRLAFVRDVVFGGASTASRPVMSVAVMRALLARADAVLSKQAADLDTSPRAIDELVRIYRFLDAEIANAGRSRGGARSENAGIPASSYEECSKALAQHLEHNPRWLKASSPIAQPAMRVRAQAALALVDMSNDASALKRVDVADRLGLAGARRKLFLELGTLVLDTGKADDARVDRMRAIIERLPSVRADVEAISFGEENPRLVARGAVLSVKAPLESAVGDDKSPFGDEVEPAPFDGTTLEIARELASFVVRRAMDSRAELRVLADRDLRAADSSPYGNPRDASVEAGLAAALQLLLTDAPRAMDLAFVRFLAGRPDSAAVMSDALGVLAAFAPPARTDAGLTLTLGRPKGTDGSTESVGLTNVRLLPSGAVTSFLFAGHAWTLTRDLGPVGAIRRDGNALTIGFLASARVPAVEATSWSTPGLVLAKMHGSPKAGVAPGPKVRFVGAGETGYDAVAALAPGENVVVEADVTVTGQTGGVAVRAISAKEGFRGAAVMLTPWPSPRIALVLREDDGFESFLAAPQDVRELGAVHVRLAVKGTKVEAKVGDLVLKGTIPAVYGKGDVAIFGRKGATVEATGFSVKRQ